MADFDTLFTEAESKALLNKCGVNYDIGHFSFKPRLFFGKNHKTQPIAANNATEMALLDVIAKHQDLNLGLHFEHVHNCKTIPETPHVYVGDILRSGREEKFTCALTHRNNYYVDLEKLMYVSGHSFTTAEGLRATRYYEALVTFMVAATHYDTIVPHLKWLCSSDFNTDYKDVVELSKMSNILKTKSTDPFNMFNTVYEYLPLTLDYGGIYQSSVLDGVDEPLVINHYKQSALETVVFGIEVLNRIESIKDVVLRDALYGMFKGDVHCDAVKLMYDWDDTGIRITPEVQRIISITDMEQRYYAIRDFVWANMSVIEDSAMAYISNTTKCVHPVFGEFIKFCQSESIMNIRLKTIFILYNYVKSKGWLSELNTDKIDDNSIPMLGASSPSGSTPTGGGTEVPETYSMMNFDHAVHDSEAEACADASDTDSKAHKSDTGISFEELDRLAADFKSSKYAFKVTTNESLDNSLRDSYTAISDKMTLLNKALIRSIKDIKVYNTGGKNIGKKTGKLDRKNLYKYKTTKDIFFDNTYKVKESDLAFGIILDVSGSMRGHGIRDGVATMIVLHETLKALNINHSIVTHTSDRYHQSVIKRYQLFKEDKNFKCTKNYALAGIEAGGGNCDSGALYYMEQCMKRVKNKDKICIMFSDGEPTECSETELKDQVRHMEKNGIKVIGVGIDFPSIKEYYSNNANGRNLKEMFNIVSGILKQYVLEKVDKE